MKTAKQKKIWIDLDNSPHVPFFKPIIAELMKNNYAVLITARDCFQVCGLADLLKVNYKRIGVHYGKNKALKVLGLLVRTLQLLPVVLRERPAIAVSHGSRAQMLLSFILRIPFITIYDYEFTKSIVMLHPTIVIVPEIIPDSSIKYHKSLLYKYPGIKEDVYVPDFTPDPHIREMLGLNEDDIVVTIRPPASEAHYHSPESDKLFSATVEYLAEQKNVKIVILPRNDKQAQLIRTTWPGWFSQGKVIIPREVVDGLNLMWYSDFVISGGGTMNREAAALGVPVYSIFRGKIGAVDGYLSQKGRLILIETADDVRSKIQLTRRPKGQETRVGNREALKKISSVIEELAEKS